MYISYGEWTIDANITRTRMYYGRMSAALDQFSRNFRLYCDRLTGEEHAFFDAFGIDPKRIFVENTDVTGKRSTSIGGYFYIFGRFISTPSQPSVSVSELIKNGFSAFNKDTSVKIGSFNFEFQLESDPYCDIPDDMPDECICVRFFCEDMEWLLPEKCRGSVRVRSRIDKLLSGIAGRVPRKERAEKRDKVNAARLLAATTI